MKSAAALTKRTIEALKPRACRYDVFDGQLPGFSVRVHPNGRRTYRFKFILDRRQRVITIGEHGAPWTPETARRRAQALRGRVAAHDNPVHDRAPPPASITTVAQIIELWLREGPAAAPNKRASSWRHDASRLRRHIVPLLGDQPLAKLTRQDIERAQHAIADGRTAVDVRTRKRGRAIVTGGRAAARSAITAFSACLTWAVAQGAIAKSPASGLKKFATVRRERFLDEDETARLLSALDILQTSGRLSSAFADAFRLLLLTGARKTEIAALRWDEVDLVRGTIALKQGRAKNGDKTVALNAPAVALIAARPRGSRYVFASTIDETKPIVGLQKAWARVRVAAALPDLRVHDLRHSFASIAAADGASLPMIAKALGHAHPATTSRYAHLADDAAHRVADGVGQRLEAVRKRRANPMRQTSASARPSTSGH